MFPWAAQVVPEVEAFRLNGPRREALFQLLQQITRGGWSDLVLDDDVRLKSLAILRGEIIGERLRELPVKALEGRRGEAVGDSFAEGTDAGDLKREGRLRGREVREDLLDVWCVGKCVEESDVRCDVVALRRKVALAQPIEVRLRGRVETNSEDGAHGRWDVASGGFAG